MAKFVLFLILGGILWSGVRPARAQEILIERFLETPVQGDFVLQPAKVELSLHPGEQAERTLYVTNRLGVPARFSLEVADITGSTDPYEGARLSGSDEVAQYFNFEAKEFTLVHGERARIPVTIRVPSSASPGEISGAVLVSGASPERIAGSAQITSRAGALFFVRVEGGAQEGLLRSFSLNRRVATMVFENTGVSHLNPYGMIEVRNIFSKTTKVIPIDPWFVLPGSTRARSIALGDDRGWGRFSAKLSLNRGYADIIDTKVVVFWMLPSWQWIGGLFILVLLGAAGFYRPYRKSMKKFIFLIAALLLSTVLGQRAIAEIASSTNYKIQFDSINIGGLISTSTTYQTNDTVGDAATGTSTSSTYEIRAGYRHMNESYIAISSPANVAMSPAIVSNGGTGEGSAAWTVTTDNIGGYILTVAASTDPALTASSDSFANYSPAGSVPDFTWHVSASASEFGFTPSGSHITDTYKDNGSSCATGSSDTANACWAAVTTSNTTIARSFSANQPSGTATTVKFRAEAGSARNQSAASYSATITATALAQ
ncbi:MAG TPA: hypothetical protein VJC20_03830 [Candidatus Paceibacterota bacterium]